MDKLPVGQLPDLASSNNDDEIMVITNSEYSQLKKEKISDLITDFTSTDENNALTKGTDGKMFVTDFGNASNITEGTLPVSVLPDIPKDKLPEIETTDLPASGVAANTYAYPSSVTVNAQGQVTAIEEGTPSGANANVDLSNITDAGKEVIKENSKSGTGLEICDIGMALYVDETKGLRRYLNGQIVDRNTNTEVFFTRLQEITTLHPSLLCTEEEWQAAKTMSAFGQVGKFVFNYSGEEIVSVRIPAIVNVQGLFDLQNLGMTVGAGLPNITGNFGACQVRYPTTIYTNGVFGCSQDGSGNQWGGSGSAAAYRFDLNASRASTIYGNSDTVQPEAIQYPYFIQVATGAETENNIINEIELNNPFFFGMSQYFDVEPNNLSWLKSAGQWNSKAVYPDYYNWILEQVNSGVDGFKGIGYAYSTADSSLSCWITSTIPAVGQTVYGNSPIRAIGKIESLITNGFVFTDDTSTQRTVTRNSVHDAPITDTNWINDYDFVLNTADETFRLPLKTKVAPSTESLPLYFYVGETVQNANLINAGRIEEKLVDKTDWEQAASASMPSNKYIDLTLGASGSSYTAPADGWFYVEKLSTGATQSIAIISSTLNVGKMLNYSTNNNAPMYTSAPVFKNEIITILYTLGGTTVKFRFYYSIGETK